MSENVRFPVQLKPEQQRALDALLTGATDVEAAAAAGVSDRTIRRWETEPVFAAALRAAQCTAFDRTVARIAGAASKAEAVLLALLKAKDEEIRLRAAVAFLKLGRDARSDDLLEQVQDLARRVSKLDGQEAAA